MGKLKNNISEADVESWHFGGIMLIIFGVILVILSFMEITAFMDGRWLLPIVGILAIVGGIFQYRQTTVKTKETEKNITNANRFVRYEMMISSFIVGVILVTIALMDFANGARNFLLILGFIAIINAIFQYTKSRNF